MEEKHKLIKNKLWFRAVKVSCSKGNHVLKYNRTNYASENCPRTRVKKGDPRQVRGSQALFQNKTIEPSANE